MAQALGVVIVGASILLALAVARYVLRILHHTDALLKAKAEGHRLENQMMLREIGQHDPAARKAGFHG